MFCTGDCVECLEKGEDMEGEFESCDIGHERIIYFGSRCPLCEASYRLEAFNDTIDDLLMVLEPVGVEA
jgi:hypothetical protein